MDQGGRHDNKEFARKVEISPVQLSRVLNGKSRFSSETAERVSQLTAISLASLQKINIVNIVNIKRITTHVNKSQVKRRKGLRRKDNVIPYDPLWTVKQVAYYLHKHISSIYDMVRSGVIPATRVGRGIRFRKSDIDRWLTERGNGNGDHS